MAKVVLTNAHISYDGTDLSDHGRSLDVPLGRETFVATSFSDSVVNQIAGLKTQGPVQITFVQDYAASSVEATLAGADDGAVIVLTLRPDSGSVTTSNPQLSGNFLQQSYQSYAGSVSGEHLVTATLVPGDGTGFTRTTS